MTKKNTSAFKTYSQELRTRFKGGDATEHTYRPALQAFIESFGGAIRATNEPGKKGRGSNSKNKPDFIVKRGAAPLGFIETKDIGINLTDTEDSEQIERYCKAFPNLIVTDYLEFRRYVRGELRAEVKIGKSKKNEITLTDTDGEDLVKFFEDFLLEETFTITSAAELADRLASLTLQIRKLVKKELSVEEDSARLHKLMLAFKKVLIADLDVNTFSDMFAQTLAYGFFAAKVHFDGKGEFSRRTASSILPKTNPFLKKLFREFADDNLPEALVGAVDEIIELLKKTDIKKILEEFGAQGKNDAVIHFYESFLGAYDPQLKKNMGVFYTPDPVVTYMVSSLDQILISKFGRKKGLADDKTLILDPALGTGSFLHKIVEKIHSRVQKGGWDSYVADNLLDRIFGFEILMAPYAVAHLNLGLQLQKTGYTFEKEQRLGVFLTNTLEETAKRSEVLFEDWISEEANAAASIKREKPIMVVTGNPPYSGESQNDGEWIEKLMKGTDILSNRSCANYFQCDGQPLKEKQQKWLHDDYVKFLRFAHWRIEQTGNGVVAFITAHGYLDNPTFCGMRQALMSDFNEIYLLDLHGNSKKKETAPDGSKDENVFDIQQGVSICFLVRNAEIKKGATAKVFKADLFGDRNNKYEWLSTNDWESTKYKEIFPETPNYLFIPQNTNLKKEYEVGIKVTELFPTHGTGIVTARDNLTIAYSADEIWKRVKDFSTLGEAEAREKYDLGKDARDWKVKTAQADVEKSGPKKENIKAILYRPFDTRFTYYTGQGKGFIGQPCAKVMRHMLADDNMGLCFARPMSPRFEFSVSVTTSMVDQCTIGNKSAGAGISYLAPLWLHDGKLKSANFNKNLLARIEELGTPEEFFNYTFAILSSSDFRNKYSEFLKIDYPRVQLTDDKKLFNRLSKLGAELAGINLLQDERLGGGKVTFSIKGTNKIEAPRYDNATKRLYINEKQYFEGVTEEQWNHQVGGYNVLEKWLKDRKKIEINHDQIIQFERIAESFLVSKKVIEKIDAAIRDAGGWPLEQQPKVAKRKSS